MAAAPIADPHAKRDRIVLQGDVPRDQSAARLRVSYALSPCVRPLQGGDAAVEGSRGRPAGGVSFGGVTT